MKAGVEFCRTKGYRRIYGRAQKDLLDYYVNMGWKQLEGSSEFFFSDYAYIEIVIDTDPKSECDRARRRSLCADAPRGPMGPSGRAGPFGAAWFGEGRSRQETIMKNVVNLRSYADVSLIPTLVLLDMQQEYIASPRLYSIPDAETALENCRLALMHSRRTGLPVAFLRMVDVRRSSIRCCPIRAGFRGSSR